MISMREEYDRRRQLMWRGFNELGLACAEPRGAFYAFPSVAQTGYDDETFAEQLLLQEQGRRCARVSLRRRRRGTRARLLRDQLRRHRRSAPSHSAIPPSVANGQVDGTSEIGLAGASLAA